MPHEGQGGIQTFKLLRVSAGLWARSEVVGFCGPQLRELAMLAKKRVKSERVRLKCSCELA